MKNTVFHRTNLTTNFTAFLWTVVVERARDFGVQDTQYIKKLTEGHDSWAPKFFADFCATVNRTLEQSSGCDPEDRICAQLGIENRGTQSETIFLYYSCQSINRANDCDVCVSSCWSDCLREKLKKFWDENQNLTQEARLPLINFQTAIMSMELKYDPYVKNRLHALKGADYQCLLEGDKLLCETLGIQESMIRVRSVGREAVSDSGRLGTPYRHLNSTLDNLKELLNLFNPQLATNLVASYLLPIMLVKAHSISDLTNGSEFYEFFQKREFAKGRLGTGLKNLFIDQPDLFALEFYNKYVEKLSISSQSPTEPSRSETSVKPEAKFVVDGYSGPCLWF